jgi:arginyl-tRNA synthetase
MDEVKTAWKGVVARALAAYAREKNVEAVPPAADAVVVEKPPKPELGDLGFPMFPYAKLFRSSPAQVAQGLAALIAADPEARALGSAAAEGPYLNVRLDRGSEARRILAEASASDWGKTRSLAGKRIMVEFSSPNTNKPLHLGHLRNDILGESLSRVLRAAGAEVRTIDHINDRGIHICKSMLAYLKYGEGHSPADEGLKGDHFVGKYYVLFNKLMEEDPKAEEKAQEMLRKWEAGDAETRKLWSLMRKWVLEGLEVTYARTGVHFDLYDYESETYELGVDKVLAGLETGVFYKEPDGSVWGNFEDIGLDRKVFLRKDGTSLYITQDIGTAIARHEGWPYDSLVYVVANEQQYHFKILFETLKRLGFDWARDLHHLAYGMVNLPSGRMKTREGTVVDADDLIDELAGLAAAEIEKKGREDAVGDTKSVAEKISIGALHYYLLATAPTKDMLYDPVASLSFNGDTGPYIQYMGARASSIIRKHEAGEGNAVKGAADPAKLSGEADWALVKLVSGLPRAIEEGAAAMDPSIVAAYLHELASGFSTWYRENPVLNCPDFDLAASRLELVRAVKRCLEAGTAIVDIPFLETM